MHYCNVVVRGKVYICHVPPQVGRKLTFCRHLTNLLRVSPTYSAHIHAWRSLGLYQTDRQCVIMHVCLSRLCGLAFLTIQFHGIRMCDPRTEPRVSVCPVLMKLKKSKRATT